MVVHLVGVGGNLFPCCEQCGMQTRNAGFVRHESTASCRSRAHRHDWHAVAARCAAATKQAFTVDEKPLRCVESFKYLGCLTAYDNTDVPAARRQLSRAHAVWRCLRKVTEKEGVSASVTEMSYQAVLAAVLLYDSESWVLPDAQLARLEDFHVECARKLTGMWPRKRGDNWVYTPQVSRHFGRRESPTPQLLHSKAKDNGSQGHRHTAHPGGVQRGSETAQDPCLQYLVGEGLSPAP